MHSTCEYYKKKLSYDYLLHIRNCFLNSIKFVIWSCLWTTHTPTPQNDANINDFYVIWLSKTYFYGLKYWVLCDRISKNYYCDWLRKSLAKIDVFNRNSCLILYFWVGIIQSGTGGIDFWATAIHLLLCNFRMYINNSLFTIIFSMHSLNSECVLYPFPKQRMQLLLIP